MTDEDGEDVALRIQRALHAFSGVRFPALGLAERLHGFVRGIRLAMNRVAIPMAELPAAFGRLSAEQVEDILCIYRVTLARLKRE